LAKALHCASSLFEHTARHPEKIAKSPIMEFLRDARTVRNPLSTARTQVSVESDSCEIPRGVDCSLIPPRRYKTIETHWNSPFTETLLPAPAAPFSINPLADIRRTIFQPDFLRFAARQELHGFAIHQHDFSQIEDDVLSGRLQTEEPLQLVNVLDLDSTAQGKGRSRTRRPLNLQHG
jgi:hypothetical protein